MAPGCPARQPPASGLLEGCAPEAAPPPGPLGSGLTARMSGKYRLRGNGWGMRDDGAALTRGRPVSRRGGSFRVMRGHTDLRTERAKYSRDWPELECPSTGCTVTCRLGFAQASYRRLNGCSPLAKSCAAISNENAARAPARAACWFGVFHTVQGVRGLHP